MNQYSMIEGFMRYSRAMPARSQARVDGLGSLEGTRVRFYAVTVERQLEHPAVQAICDAAHNV